MEGFPTYLDREKEETEDAAEAISVSAKTESRRHSGDRFSLVQSNKRRLSGIFSLPEETLPPRPVINLHFNNGRFSKTFIPIVNHELLMEKSSLHPCRFTHLHDSVSGGHCIARSNQTTQIFRLTDQALTPSGKKERRRKKRERPKVVTISIWEEFYYGDSLLDKKYGRPSLTTLSGFLYEIFRGVVPLIAIDILVLLIFISVFFMSCIMYNMFWQLLSFYLLKKHLSLHEKAEKKNINVKFTGNAFQGPGFIYIRQVWCAHCAQIANTKITTKLMDGYRVEMKKKKKVDYKSKFYFFNFI